MLQALGYKAPRPLDAVLGKGEVFDRYSSENFVGEPDLTQRDALHLVVGAKPKWVLSAGDLVTNPLKQIPRHPTVSSSELSLPILEPDFLHRPLGHHSV